MKRFVRALALSLAFLLILTFVSCSSREELIPDADVPLEGAPAPTLPTVGMEPEEAAEAFVEAYLRSAYLSEDDAFTQYTAASLAEFDPAGGAVMNGEAVTNEALKRNARYWQEKAKWFRYIRAAQGIARKDFAAPCTSGVTESGEDWANVTVSGMMSFTYADSGESSGMEFNFELNMVRTDHRTSYAWVVGDAVEPLDPFDAEHKNVPEFSADALIAEYSLTDRSYASGKDSPKAWKLTDVLREVSGDREHNRCVRIMELEADSAHTEEINAVIRDEFGAIYDRYMEGTQLPYDHWRLVIDTEAWEEDGILCIAAVADEPSTYLFPLTVRNVFLDLASDELLTLDEYAERVGIDPDSVAAETAAGFDPHSRVIGCECSGVFREAGKTVYVILLTYDDDGTNVTQDTMLVEPGGMRIQDGRFPGFIREP